MAAGEFGLIQRHFSQIGAKRADLLLGIGDDCALLQPVAGQALAVTTDTLVAGVHFLASDPPQAIAHKAVAVNLSDLAAMGADPAWISLALTLPQANSQWLAQFSHGLDEILRYYNVALIGGDTTRGPLAVSITAHGWVPVDRALRRSGAKSADRIYVSGRLGEAAAGLAIMLGQYNPPSPWREPLLQHLHYPTPRLALGRELRGIVSAAIDISDGLLADLGHILDASAVSAVLAVEQLPLAQLPGEQLEQARHWALAGGDDYELCFCVPPAQCGQVEAIAKRLGVPLSCIGEIRPAAAEQLRLQLNGQPFALPPQPGYNHFQEG